jgi:hypothetical protein
MTYPVCPCDATPIEPPLNLPELSHISYRVGTYVDFRSRVLTPLYVPAIAQPLPAEQTLSVNGVPVWRTDGSGDLAVMIAEWFAYIADVITFYNERIANQGYLRTADMPESVRNLIALLGYRPRPAIGAVGNLAALLSPGPSLGGAPIVLPQGLQFQSKPSPGQPPQTFELLRSTAIGAPDQLPAEPAPNLLASVPKPRSWIHYAYHVSLGNKFGGGSALGGGYGGPVVISEPGESSILLQGRITSIDPGALLRLRVRDGSSGPWLATVGTSTVNPAPSGSGQQTNLVVTLSSTSSKPPATLTAAEASLESANQNTAIWTIFSGSIGGATVHLASLVRQIRPGDWLLFTAKDNTPSPVLLQVADSVDVIWDATGSPSAPDTPKNPTYPVPIPHTQLTLEGSGLSSDWDSANGVTVQFGWVSVGTLLNQPFGTWSGSPTQLIGTTALPFPAWSTQPIELQDSTGLGVQTTGSSAGDHNLAIGTLPDPVPPLQPPFLVLPNLLPVSRGKTVANEILGSGDPTNAAQDFQLSQAPVTYLSRGASYASTVNITVNNLPWTEVASFYGQPADAKVYVTREDNNGNTHVMFGDGVNGARLPAGRNNVVASYRIGAGAAMPPAGKLTVIAKPYPGLRAVLNPVAVSGGSDPDPPDQISRYAPRSVLTFGRAVSVFDYAALASQVPTVTRASAVWAWNDARQRTVVTVYVGDDSSAAAAAKTALLAVGDPNRPVIVVQATQVAVALSISLLVTPGMDVSIITAAVVTALTDTEVGLFGSWNLQIGQTVFDSQIEAAVLGVQGAVAIIAQTFQANGATDPGPLHLPGEGAFYTLAPGDIQLTTEPDPNG